MIRFNIRAMAAKARQRGTRSRATSLPIIVPTGTLQRDLERILTRVALAWWTGARDLLIPAYRSALAKARPPVEGVLMDDANDLAGTTESIAQMVERLILTLTPDVSRWTLRVEQFHRERWAANLTPVGVQLGTLLGPADVAATVGATVAQNASLIRSLSSEARTRIEGIVFRGFQARAPASEIAKQISEAVGLSRDRARRIAADQTVKLSARLDTERMMQAGIEEWTWIHSGKRHFRKFHKARNGRRYRFDDPPSDMPGDLPFCGCHKRAEL